MTPELIYKAEKDMWLSRCRGLCRYGERWNGSLELAEANYCVLCIEWINNKVLVYSTGNYIHYLVINHNGKQFSKKCIFMYNRITFLYSRINTAW